MRRVDILLRVLGLLLLLLLLLLLRVSPRLWVLQKGTCAARMCIIQRVVAHPRPACTNKQLLLTLLGCKARVRSTDHHQINLLQP